MINKIKDMKTYIEPTIKIVELKAEGIIAASGGVDNGSTTINNYNEDDVSYSKEDNGGPFGW